jgi:hypothetical protein
MRSASGWAQWMMPAVEGRITVLSAWFGSPYRWLQRVIHVAPLKSADEAERTSPRENLTLRARNGRSATTAQVFAAPIVPLLGSVRLRSLASLL